MTRSYVTEWNGFSGETFDILAQKALATMEPLFSGHIMGTTEQNFLSRHGCLSMLERI